jgi:hypothetical protein
MVEPGDLWTRRLPGAFCNRSPHVRPREGGGGLVCVLSQRSPFKTSVDLSQINLDFMTAQIAAA